MIPYKFRNHHRTFFKNRSPSTPKMEVLLPKFLGMVYWSTGIHLWMWRSGWFSLGIHTRIGSPRNRSCMTIVSGHLFQVLWQMLLGMNMLNGEQHWLQHPSNSWGKFNILLMEEILHQLIGSLSMFIPLFTRFYTSQVVVWDFFRQQYH